MDVKFQKNDDVKARLTVSITEADYNDKVTKELKKIGQTHTLPGFRKGHVPFGELKRRFGQAVTSDIINDVVYEAVTGYMRDNKIDILGEPLPVEVKPLDLKNQKDYTFEYDLALAPDVNIKIDKDITVPYYTIKVTDEMIAEDDANLRKRFGAQVPGEEFEKDALVKGVLMQLDEDGKVNTNEGAIQVTAAIVAPFTFKSAEEAAKFEGKKVGDKVVFNPWNSCDGNPGEMGSMLNLDKEIAKDVKSDFELAISEIIVVRPAELNEDFFKNVFGPDKVHNEEEYREALKQGIAGRLVGNSEMLFRRDAQNIIMEKFGKLNLAEDLLKQWLLRRNADQFTAENIDEQFKSMLPGLIWQILSDRISQQLDVKLEENDILQYAIYVARQQFAQYGMTNLSDDIVENYAKNLLEDKNFRNRAIQQAGDAKLFVAIKNAVTLDNHEVTLEEFTKLISTED